MPTLLPYYAALFGGILIAVCGQLLLKAGVQGTPDIVAQITNGFTIVGVGFYGCAAFLYLIAIRKIPLSIAYPSVAVSYVVVALVAHFFWDETLTAGKVVAVLFILAGVALLQRA
ncbi:MAG: EamA family transporter [Alphaproteobacteria bacterium]|nr:EamA family transporter [Alphaproteobacteria bacterium]MDE2513105.1 EamA family transporter [Alphaproteobacteria bacterium]